MSAFTEFIGIAIALYLWESTLWLPLRGVALRRRWLDPKWRVLSPGSWVATREVGVIQMLLLPPDVGLAPCQAPPLLVTDDGKFILESSTGVLHHIPQLTWDDLKEKEPYLTVSGVETRISSPGCIAVLRRAKQRGATPTEAVRLAWRLALSPARAGREWRRWKLVSGPLRWYGPILTLGGLVGLPLAYVYLSTLQTLFLALWLWLIMGCAAAHLWWLGKRVYPGAKSALRMDAVLSLLVPFHAMRAVEIASIHAMATTHPVALILSSGDLKNPWLSHFMRRILFPLPGVVEDMAFAAALNSPLTRALLGCGRKLEDFDTAPDHADDPAAACYCPRCHGRYLAQVNSCPDCTGVKLRSFA